MNPMPEIDLVDMGFGHGITASPLQLAQAMSVFANGGVMVPLRLVKGRIDPGGGEMLNYDPSVPIQVISPSTAATMQDFMIGVVEEGTATRAKTAWTCAGKTGTAQKIDPAGGYYDHRFFATFAGYGPIPNPKWVIVIILDDPHYPYFGGTSCGPIFHQLFTALMIREGIPPQREPNSTLIPQGEAIPIEREGPPEVDASNSVTSSDTDEFVLSRDPFGSDGEAGSGEM
jgi:cell division protein FtsI/penicillin-binding protein 2